MNRFTPVSAAFPSKSATIADCPPKILVMRYLFLIATFLFFTYGALAQKPDVVSIQKQDLAFKYLQTGKASYLIYFKKTEDGPATNLTLVNIEVEPSTFNGRKAYSVRQKW